MYLISGSGVLQTTKDENTTISTVTFKPKMEDSGKFLTCRVGPSPHVAEEGWKLNIHRKYQTNTSFDRRILKI